MTTEINSSADITEEFLMTLLCQVGEARAAFMDAMQAARRGEFEQSQTLIQAGDAALTEVHKSQTSLIGFDQGEGRVTMTLILTHIQDHIMTTMLCRDMAEEVSIIHQKLQKVLDSEKAHL